MVDQSWLPGVYLARNHEVIHGPLAEFFPDGQLRSLSRYVDGRMSTAHNRLQLAQGVPEGTVTCDGIEIFYSFGVEEVLIDLSGDVDHFVGSVTWESWVRKWIEHITAGSNVNVLE